MSELVIGIDLGTTNSLVAFADQHGPRIIPSPAGQLSLPSVVHVDPRTGHLTVGDEARSQAVELLSAQGVTRLDLLNYISHGVRKGPPRERAGEGGPEGEGSPAGEGEEEGRPSKDPLAAYASNLTERAREG